MSHKYYKTYKPIGYVSQFINNKTRPKHLLSDLYDFPEGTMAVGRLDVKSEGLLLLTTDGKFSHHICSSKFEKEYWVQVSGEVSQESIEKLREGVEISIKGEKHQTLPCEVDYLTDTSKIFPNPKGERDPRHGPMTWLKIIIREGKYHQVRKMTATQGHGTHRLIRWRVGDYTYDNLEVGEVEEIRSS